MWGEKIVAGKQVNKQWERGLRRNKVKIIRESERKKWVKRIYSKRRDYEWMRKFGESGDRMFSPQWLSIQQLKRISSDLNRFQTQTTSPSASPPDPPLAPGIELGLPHYTVAMGTLTPPLTKWEPRKAELLIRMCVCITNNVCTHWNNWCLLLIFSWNRHFIHQRFTLYLNIVFI